jgi:para-nitrobenzyl esterase
MPMGRLQDAVRRVFGRGAQQSPTQTPSSVRGGTLGVVPTSAEPIVTTRQGAVRGRHADGIFAFKGIPYAAPPFGPNRFRPPQPAASWDGVRDALACGPTAPKPPYPAPFDILLPEPVIPGEECLNLNIWTPDLGRSAALPVMVWIHGGSYRNGSGAVPTYDGTHFARDGVVCVTLNYRLGVDGFLALGDGIANLGLLDQIAALRWVQDNIAAFGGDPSRVTIFGESAGGMSVSTLLAMPQAIGLFSRAIAQSGAAHYVLPMDTAKQMGRYLAEELGVEPTRAAIAAAPLERLVQAQVALRADQVARPDPQRWGETLATGMLFQPVIDGDTLDALPITRITGGSGAKVDLLVGSNSEEYRFFMVPPGLVDLVTDEYLAAAVAGYGLPVEQALATYRAATSADTRPGDLLAAIVTDRLFRIPAIRMAEARATAPAATYVYEFAWRSPQFNARLGASHAVEIAFVFDNLAQPENEPLIGSAPPQPIADVMHAAWVAFARNGVPRSPAMPDWPRYDLTRRATMRFDSTPGVVEDPGAAERALWDGIR